MVLDQAFVGRVYPPTAPYEVAREKIREFAEAIGDTNPAYTDPQAARGLGYPDVIAPPTFAIAITMRAASAVIADPALGLDYSRVVHGEQRFAYHRPLCAGDIVTVTVSVDSVRSVGGNELVTTRADVAAVNGEAVLSAWSTLVARGTGGGQ
jgi:acyl dehydratase